MKKFERKKKKGRKIGGRIKKSNTIHNILKIPLKMYFERERQQKRVKMDAEKEGEREKSEDDIENYF